MYSEGINIDSFTVANIDIIAKESYMALINDGRRTILPLCYIYLCYYRLVNSVQTNPEYIHVAESPDYIKMRSHVSHSYTSEKLQA